MLTFTLHTWYAHICGLGIFDRYMGRLLWKMHVRHTGLVLLSNTYANPTEHLWESAYGRYISTLHAGLTGHVRFVFTDSSL